MEQIKIQVVMRSDRKDYFANGLFDGKGITIFKGSKVSTIINSSIRFDIDSLRSNYLDKEGRLLRDLYFKTPSAASNFVCGRNSNGWKEWVTLEGINLSEYKKIYDEKKNTFLCSVK